MTKSTCLRKISLLELPGDSGSGYCSWMPQGTPACLPGHASRSRRNRRCKLSPGTCRAPYGFAVLHQLPFVLSTAWTPESVLCLLMALNDRGWVINRTVQTGVLSRENVREITQSMRDFADVLSGERAHALIKGYKSPRIYPSGNAQNAQGWVARRSHV